MTIQVTFNEILHRGDWKKFCDITGTSIWAVNEGGGDVQVTLSEDQAIELGLLKVEI